MKWIAESEQDRVPHVDHHGLAIAELVDEPPPTPKRIDAFVERHDFPIVEGSRCTFVYRGEARSVALRHWKKSAKVRVAPPRHIVLLFTMMAAKSSFLPPSNSGHARAARRVGSFAVQWIPCCGRSRSTVSLSD